MPLGMTLGGITGRTKMLAAPLGPAGGIMKRDPGVAGTFPQMAPWAQGVKFSDYSRGSAEPGVSKVKDASGRTLSMADAFASGPRFTGPLPSFGFSNEAGARGDMDLPKPAQQRRITGVRPPEQKGTDAFWGLQDRGNPAFLQHREKGGPVKGRTSGLSKFYQDQQNLKLERSAQGARDPITGLSQTPKQAEIDNLISYLSGKGEEFPGYDGLTQALLIRDYYQAKQSGNPEALAAATRSVQDYKNKLDALRAQAAGEIPYVTNENGKTEAVKFAGEKAQIIPGGEHVETFPKDGTIIPAQKTAQLVSEGNVAPNLYSNAMGAAGRPTAAPVGRTASISTKYGTGSVAPTGTTAKVFNMGNTYDPNFGKKAQALTEAEKFAAVQEPVRPTGEGSGFEAVAESPQQAWQREAAGMVDQQRTQSARDWMAKNRAGRTSQLSSSRGGAFSSPVGSPLPLIKKALQSVPKLFPTGAIGAR